MAEDKNKGVIVLSPDASGKFVIPATLRSEVQRIDIVDIDLIITTKSGQRYLLPGAGIAAMGENPPDVIFSNGDVPSDQLLAEVGAVLNLAVEIPVPSSLKLDGAQEGGEGKDNAQVQQQQSAEQKKDQQEAQESKQAQVSSLTVNTEQSVEQMVAGARKIDENLHKSDYDYVPPHPFNPPPNPVASPPGVPPPISLTPIVNLFMGNVVGETTVAGSGVTYIYGGGGAANTNSSVQIGPRDPLQFSAATITGTSGNDIIYANGPLVGNAVPSTDRSLNAKEFLLNVAGYFTRLNDVVISGVPTGVSISGATSNGGGVWTLPAATVTTAQSFTIVYDMDAWRSGSNTFDLSFNISGLTTRSSVFDVTQTFRFQYMDVTSTSQVTEQTLIYDSRGITKQIYVLPTASNQSIINSGEGDDIIHGDRNADVITAGNGNNNIQAAGGDDTVTVGSGINTIDLGAGTNTLTAGSGVNTITAADGNNLITVGDGGNIITIGSGSNTIVSGSGADAITAGNGANTITDSGGDNVIILGSGVNIVSTESGNDALTVEGGGGTFDLGAGNNTLTVNSASGSTAIYDLITSGAGTTNVVAGDGNYTITTASGVATVVVGAGTSTITTSGGDDFITVGNGTMVVNAGSGSNTIATGTGAVTVVAGSGNDTVTSSAATGTINVGDGTNNISTTTGNLTIVAGSGDDTLSTGDGGSTVNMGDGTNSVSVGNGNNNITTGVGNDTIVAGNGNNTFNVGLGTNSITAGTGVNTLSFMDITTTAVTVSLVSNTAVGTSLSDSFSGINGIIGSDVGNTITGNTSANTLTGGAAADVISGGGGNDTLYGLGGNDTITGGTGNDTIYGGNGNNTIYTGTAGTDLIYGGTGNNTFISQHAGVTYNGTNSAAITTGTNNLVYSYTNGTTYNFYLNAQVNMVDYSSGSAATTVNLLSGIGVGGQAEGDNYAFTPVSGVSTINAIIGGSGGDTITGSNGDDYINGGSGNDNLTGGLGNNILVGALGSNIYNGGLGNDTFIGSVAGYDTIYYNNSLAGVVVNLGSTDRNFDRAVFGGTGIVSVTAYSGASKGITSIDNNAYSIGDTYAVVSGASTSIEQVVGSYAGDVIFNGSSALNFYSNSGSDLYYGGSSTDNYLVNTLGGTDRVDGAGGTDTFTYPSYVSGAAYVYLSGVSDTNLNGTADYLDRGLTSLTNSGVVYTGFAKFSANTSAITYLINIENITTSGGNDVLAGDGNANTLDGGTGANTLYGMDGNDTLIASGVDTLYGGNGTDTFNVASTNLSLVQLFDGGAGTDTVRVTGLTSMSAGSITNSQYTGIETYDVRNSTSGNTYAMNANDITGLVDAGTSSSVTLKLDTGDTYTPTVGAGSGALSYLVASTTATNTIYWFYSDASHATLDATNRVAILDVYKGVG